MQPPVPTHEPVFRSQRSADGLVLGVCEGLARSRDLDPLVVRAGFVLAGISGVGVIWYLLCALWMVREGETEPAIHSQVPSTRQWTRRHVTWMFVAGSILGIMLFGSLMPAGPLPVLVLALVWWLARRQQRRDRATAPQFAPPPVEAPGWMPVEELDPASASWQARLAEVYHGTGEISPAPTLLSPPTPQAAPPAHDQVRHVPAKRRPRSWALSLVLWGVAAAAFGLGFPLAGGRDPYAIGLALALAATGLVLVLTSWWRRPHLGVLTGLVLAISLAATVAPPVITPAGPMGTVVYTSEQGLPRQMTLTARETHLDFGELDLTDSHTLTLDVTASEVTIRLPERVLVKYRTRGGQVSEPGSVISAGSTHGEYRRGGEDGPVLTINLTVTAAEVTLL